MFFRATLLFALSDCKGTKNILDIQMFLQLLCDYFEVVKK